MVELSGKYGNFRTYARLHPTFRSYPNASIGGKFNIWKGIKKFSASPIGKVVQSEAKKALSSFARKKLTGTRGEFALPAVQRIIARPRAAVPRKTAVMKARKTLEKKAKDYITNELAKNSGGLLSIPGYRHHRGRGRGQTAGSFWSFIKKAARKLTPFVKKAVKIALPIANTAVSLRTGVNPMQLMAQQQGGKPRKVAPKRKAAPKRRVGRPKKPTSRRIGKGSFWSKLKGLSKQAVKIGAPLALQLAQDRMGRGRGRAAPKRRTPYMRRGPRKCVGRPRRPTSRRVGKGSFLSKLANISKTALKIGAPVAMVALQKRLDKGRGQYGGISFESMMRKY